MGPLEASIKGVESALRCYLADLDAMTDEEIMGCAGGSARKPVDFTFEIALLNARMAARIRGEELPPEPAEEWWTAPDEYQSKTLITDYLKSSTEELLAALKAIPEEDGARLVGSRPAFAAANFAGMHMMYHCAQLNFIQSLHGDMKMHWG